MAAKAAASKQAEIRVSTATLIVNGVQASLLLRSQKGASAKRPFLADFPLGFGGNNGSHQRIPALIFR
jgi:hypothetical protein